MSKTIRNKFIKLASCFIPSATRRRVFRSKYLPLKVGTNSVFLVSDSGEKQRLIYPMDGLQFDFAGENNVVEIHENAVFTNKGENKAYNLAKPIVIGDHVWIGYDVKIAKGVTIPDNSVVGMGAVVSGKFTEPNTIIAGNPAKVIKTNIDWDRDNAYQYNQSVSL